MNFEEANKKYKLNQIKGWMDSCDMEWLFEQSQKMKNSKIVEIGSWQGKSTSAILSAMDKSNTLSCIDTWKGTIGEDGFYDDVQVAFETFKNNIHKFNQDVNIIIKNSIESLEDIEDNSIDWLFLDADHSEEAATIDINNWIKKMKKGSLFSGHDWQFPSIKSAIKNTIKNIDGYTTHQNKQNETVGSIWWKRI